MKKLIVLSTMVLTFFFLARIGKAQTKLSFKATGGYGNMSAGDLNTVINSLDSIIAIYFATENGVTKEGTLKEIDWGLDFEGEFIMNLTNNLGIGLGAGYIQRRKDSRTSIKNGASGTVNYDVEPKITAFPIKLSAYYFYPIVPQLHIFINGGVGYYFGKSSWSLKTDYVEENYWTKSVFEVKGNGIGFHGGIGFEYNVAKNIAFFAEGSGRYAKLKDWEGDMTVRDSEGDTSGKISGTFWYFESEIYGKDYPYVVLTEDKPTDPYFRNLRKFECDLSGLSFKAGIRVKF